jgi:hypothetical protein
MKNKREVQLKLKDQQIELFKKSEREILKKERVSSAIAQSFMKVKCKELDPLEATYRTEKKY